MAPSYICLLALTLAQAQAVTLLEKASAETQKFFLEVQSAAKQGVAEVGYLKSEVLDWSANHSAWKNDGRSQPMMSGQDLDTISAVAARQKSRNADMSFSNNLVIIPCLVVGGPLFRLWYNLQPEGKGEEIFTAIDADLREVEISRVGASGVSLLRRQCDRHTGIMFAFAGIMLQTVFLYYIAVTSCRKTIEEINMEGDSLPTPIPLLFCSLFCNTLVCCASLILGMKCFSTAAPPGYEELHKAFVLMDSFVIPLVSAVVGALLLCTSRGITSLVFNATAMAFICSINMQVAGLMSWSLSGHGGRAFQPAHVSIKDSQNSTQHAAYSFIASAAVATVIIPLGLLCGIV